MTMAIILRCNKNVNWSSKTGWPPNGSTSQLIFDEPASQIGMGIGFGFEFGLAYHKYFPGCLKFEPG